MTSTSFDSVDGEADYKLDSAMYPVPYFFHPLISFLQSEAACPVIFSFQFVAISNTVFNPRRCSVEMLSNYFDVCVFSFCSCALYSFKRISL